jgi:hypothetical protein
MPGGRARAWPENAMDDNSKKFINPTKSNSCKINIGAGAHPAWNEKSLRELLTGLTRLT